MWSEEWCQSKYAHLGAAPIKARFGTQNAILSLDSKVTSTHNTSKESEMAEGGSKNPAHQEMDEEITYGPVNIKQAREYTEVLEKIIDNSREHLLAGQNDALQMMIQEMKKP